MNDIRIGFGYDFHKLIEGDSLKLADVRIKSDYTVCAHSDGDIVLHALSDSIYGAIANGDIGTHFHQTTKILIFVVVKFYLMPIKCLRRLIITLAI